MDKKNKYKKTKIIRPIENHQTAAWANITRLAHDSHVMIPDEEMVMRAKEYVDENQK